MAYHCACGLQSIHLSSSGGAIKAIVGLGGKEGLPLLAYDPDRLHCGPYGWQLPRPPSQVSKNEEALNQATAIREKELGEFNAEEKDVMQSIQALGNAVEVTAGRTTKLEEYIASRKVRQPDTEPARSTVFSLSVEYGNSSRYLPRLQFGWESRANTGSARCSAGSTSPRRPCSA